MIAGLVSHQPHPTPPSNNLNDGKSARQKCCSSSVSRGIDARETPASGNDVLTANRQRDPREDRAGLKTEVVGFSNSEETGSQNDDRRPSTQARWDLAAWIGDNLRPDDIDPKTGKRRHGSAVCGCGLAGRQNENVAIQRRSMGQLPFGAQEISRFPFGSAAHRRPVYHLADNYGLSVFHIGSTICARERHLTMWLAEKDGEAGQVAVDTPSPRCGP